MRERWYAEPPSNPLGMSDDLIQIEATVHELAHAAVFNEIDSPRRDVGDDVEFMFKNYASKHAADLSEMRTLAVECLVIRKLGLDDSIFLKHVVEQAMMRLEWSRGGVRRYVNKFSRQAINRRRTRTVLGWIRELMK